jgi:hypothetical protein
LSGTTLSGLSIGLFAAAAVFVSTSLADVAINGVESVRVAFRLAIHVNNVSERLEARDQDGNYDSWACVLTGLSVAKVQEELDRYNKEAVSNTERTQPVILLMLSVQHYPNQSVHQCIG